MAELTEDVESVTGVERAATHSSERFRSVGIIAGRIALIASSVVAVRVYTELLSPGEIGRINLVLSMYQWFSLLLVSPVGLFILRHSNAWAQTGTLHRNMRRITTYFVAIAVAVSALVALVQATVGWGIGVSTAWLTWLIAGHLFFVVLAGTNGACLNNLGRSWWFVALGNLGAWVGLAGAAVLTQVQHRAEFWLTGIVLGQVLAWILSLVAMRGLPHRPTASDDDQPPASTFTLTQVWAFAAPIVPITLAYWCQTDGFRFVLQQRAGTAEVGLFAVAFALGGTPLLAAERLLVDLLSPAFYRETASRNLDRMKEAWEEYASRLLPCMVVSVALVGGSGMLLGRVLLSQSFAQVSVYAVYGALFRACFVGVGALLLWTHAVERTGTPLLAYVAGGAVAMLGVYAFSGRSVMHGTGLSLLASSGLTLVLLYLRLRRVYGIRLPWRRLGLAALVSGPLVAMGVLLGMVSSAAGRVVTVAILLLPLGYAAVACALFSGLVSVRHVRRAAAVVQRRP